MKQEKRTASPRLRVQRHCELKNGPRKSKARGKIVRITWVSLLHAYLSILEFLCSGHLERQEAPPSSIFPHHFVLYCFWGKGYKFPEVELPRDSWGHLVITTVHRRLFCWYYQNGLFLSSVYFRLPQAFLYFLSTQFCSLQINSLLFFLYLGDQS